jgi:hypothetical protein
MMEAETLLTIPEERLEQFDEIFEKIYRDIDRKKEENLKRTFFEQLRQLNLSVEEADAFTEYLIAKVLVGDKRANFKPEFEREVDMFTEPASRIALKLDEEKERLKEWFRKYLEEEEKKRQRLTKAGIEAREEIWTAVKKALFVKAVEEGNRLRAAKVSDWLKEKEPLLKEEEPLPRRQPYLSPKEAMAIYTIMKNTQGYKNLQNLLLGRIENPEERRERWEKLYYGAMDRIHRLGYYALRNFTGSLFREVEECINNGGNFRACWKNQINQRLEKVKINQERAFRELNSPLGWLTGYIKILEIIYYQTQRSVLKALELHGKHLFNEKEMEEIKKTYWELSDPTLSKAEKVASFYNTAGKVFGGVNIPEKYQSDYIRGLVAKAIKQNLSSQELSAIYEDLYRFEEGVLSLKELQEKIDLVAKDNKKWNLIKEKLLSKVDEIESEEGRELALKEPMVINGMKLLKTDKGLLVWNTKELKRAGIEERQFISNLEKMPLDIEKPNLREYGELITSYLWQKRKAELPEISEKELRKMVITKQIEQEVQSEKPKEEIKEENKIEVKVKQDEGEKKEVKIVVNENGQTKTVEVDEPSDKTFEMDARKSKTNRKRVVKLRRKP